MATKRKFKLLIENRFCLEEEDIQKTHSLMFDDMEYSNYKKSFIENSDKILHLKLFERERVKEKVTDCIDEFFRENRFENKIKNGFKYHSLPHDNASFESFLNPKLCNLKIKISKKWADINLMFLLNKIKEEKKESKVI